MKRINCIAAFALALVVAGGTISETDAQRRGRRSTQPIQVDENADGINDGQVLRHRRGGDKLGRDGIAAQLSTAQRSELKDQISALRDGGASAEEISAAITAEFTAVGVELPEGFAERVAQREIQRVERQAQREEIKSLVEGLKADGATREEIRQALQDAGYEKPQRGRKNGRRGGSKPTPAPAPETSSVE